MTAPEQDRPWWLLPPVRIPAVWWLAILGLLLWVEYATGIYMRFPLVYVIPVSLAAYYSGRWAGLLLAISIPLAHLVFTLMDGPPTDLLPLLGTTALRGAVITCMALWFARLSELERALHKEVETLRGLLPICSFCKSIRNDAGDWERLEGYISRRSQTEFTHGVCPSCLATQEAHLD